MNKNDKYLIVGANSTFGKSILKELKNQKYKNLYILNLKSNDDYNLNKIKIKIINIKPKYVFLTYGLSGGIKANQLFPADMMFDNLFYNSFFIKIFSEIKVKKILYFSSSCIYPNQIKGPLEPKMLLTGDVEDTSRYYSIAKLSNMYLGQSFNKQYKSNFVTVIPSNYFGDSDSYKKNNSHMVSSLIKRIHEAKIKNKKKVEIWGTGKPIRDFTHLTNLAKLSIKIMHDKRIINTFINLTSGNKYSVKQVANFLKKIIGYKGKLIFNSNKKDGTLKKVLDNSEMIKYNLPYKEDFYDLLKLTYISYKNYYNK